MFDRKHVHAVNLIILLTLFNSAAHSFAAPSSPAQNAVPTNQPAGDPSAILSRLEQESHALTQDLGRLRIDKWKADSPVPRVATCDPARFDRNREIARAAAGWMDRYFSARDREDKRNRRFFAKNGPVRTRSLDWAHRGWRRVRPHLPARLANRFGATARRVEDRA